MANGSEDIENMIFNQNHDYLNIEPDHEDYIRKSLDKPKRGNIENLFQFVARVHDKEGLFDLLHELWGYEKAFSKILTTHRDHYRHSANVYALGLAIYNKSQFFRDSLIINWHRADDYPKQKASFLFRWSLASIFHDIAYPLEMSLDSFNSYSSKIQFRTQTGLNRGVGEEVTGENNFVNINSELLQNLNMLPMLRPNIGQPDTAIGLISNSLTDSQPSRSLIKSLTLTNHLERSIVSDLAQGRVDHGVFGSLILLKSHPPDVQKQT